MCHPPKFGSSLSGIKLLDCNRLISANYVKELVLVGKPYPNYHRNCCTHPTIFGVHKHSDCAHNCTCAVFIATCLIITIIIVIIFFFSNDTYMASW